MKKNKILLSIVMIMFLLGQTLNVWGQEKEWFDLKEITVDTESESILDESVEVTPFSRYIMGAKVIIKRPSTDVIMMRTEVYCTETMQSISTTFTLQKKVGTSWVNVGQKTVSTTNDNSMYKSVEATGVSAGTYRCVADTRVTSKTGYMESTSLTSNTV